MTKQTTPSQDLVAQAQASVDVTDARGRKLTLRKPGVLAQFRLVEILGETAANRTYVNMVMPTLYLAAIDGEAIPTPTSKRQIEAVVQRLDEDGLAALMDGISENWAPPDPEQVKEQLKN